jgi:hypothetical protein
MSIDWCTGYSYLALGPPWPSISTPSGHGGCQFTKSVCRLRGIDEPLQKHKGEGVTLNCSSCSSNFEGAWVTIACNSKCRPLGTMRGMKRNIRGKNKEKTNASARKSSNQVQRTNERLAMLITEGCRKQTFLCVTGNQSDAPALQIMAARSRKFMLTQRRRC